VFGAPASLVNLFVYGSLRRDATGRHHPLLSHGEFLGPGRVHGRLYRVSWHPGLHLDAEATPVHGELFHLPVEHRDAMLAALHEYEGDFFRLTPVDAQLSDGRTVTAHTYTWTGDAASGTLVPHGDWGRPEAHATV
jgi:gamma-glutamylcyclotransferase (GGCT)/AIG2-like uncharacterized protein YtfP